MILSDIEQRIKQKIEAVGTPLKEWDIKIYRGILTGCNDAFIINKEKRDELIKKCPKSAEIIRPILRGKDIKKYGYNFADKYLIATFPSKKYDIEDYPAVRDYLLNFGKSDTDYLSQYGKDCWGKKRLEQSGNKGSRKKTNNKWFELQDSIAYWDDFNKQKVVWARLMRIAKNAPDSFPRFALVDAEHYVLDSLCFFTGKNIEYLIQVLNSEYAAYYFFKNIAILDNGGMQMRQQYVESIPLPKIVVNKDIYNIDKLIYAAFNFNDEEQVFIKKYVQSRKQYLRL